MPSAAAMGGFASNRPLPQLVRRPPYGALAAVYGVLIVYVSMIPFNFAPLPVEEAWARFTSMPLLKHGSDQRSDWMGNLLMFAPLGYLWAASFGTGERRGSPGWAVAVALVLSIAFLLAIKFLQLYFPPRTVTINYVVAQSSGVAFGSFAWYFGRGHREMLRDMLERGRQSALRALLVIYASALVAAYLFPFTVIIEVEDLRNRIAELPGYVLELPGTGRPAAIQVAAIALAIVAPMVLGGLLAAASRSPIPAARLLTWALAFGIGTFAASILILSARPLLVSVGLRAGGIVLGYVVTRWAIGAAAQFRSRPSGWLVAPLVAAYAGLVLVLTVFAVPGWRTVDEALATLAWPYVMPMVNHYYVSKSQALQSTLIYLAMYAPIGVLALLLGRGTLIAVIGAVIVATLVEVGRMFTPGITPDTGNVVVAAIGAAATAVLLPRLWSLVSRPAAPAPSRSLRQAAR